MQIRGQKQLMCRAGAELAGGVGCADSALNAWRSSNRESRADSASYRPPLAEGAADLRLLLSLQQGGSLTPALKVLKALRASPIINLLRCGIFESFALSHPHVRPCNPPQLI